MKHLVFIKCFELTFIFGFSPSLVHNNVNRNLEVLKKVGLENYVIEVVTDNALDLKIQPYVREIVVPTSYVTKNKTLYKGTFLTPYYLGKKEKSSFTV